MTTFRQILCILLLQATPIFAQTDFTQVYYPIIHDAEMALIDSNFVDALDLYQGAFQNVAKHLPKIFIMLRFVHFMLENKKPCLIIWRN